MLRNLIAQMQMGSFLLIIAFTGCSKNSTNPIPVNKAPVVIAMKDTIVNQFDSIHVRATAIDDDGYITGYRWSIDGINYTMASLDDSFQVTVTGYFLRVFVMAIDNGGAQSVIDTVFISTNTVYGLSSFNEVMDSAKYAMNSGNNDKALLLFVYATQLDPAYRDAWYYAEKMTLRANSILLSSYVPPKRQYLSLPFFPDSSERISFDPILAYKQLAGLIRPCITAYDYLLHIYDGRAFKGTIDTSAIQSDFISLALIILVGEAIDQFPKDTMFDTLSLGSKEFSFYEYNALNDQNIGSFCFDTTQLISYFGNAYQIEEYCQGILNIAPIILHRFAVLDSEIQASKYSDSTDKALLAPFLSFYGGLIQEATTTLNYFKNENSGIARKKAKRKY
jgi:hypothetical protein